MSELTELKSFRDGNFRTFYSYMNVIFLLSLFCFVCRVDYLHTKNDDTSWAVPEEADLNPEAEFIYV